MNFKLRMSGRTSSPILILHLMFHLIFRSIWYDRNYNSRYYPAVEYSIIQYIHLKMPIEKTLELLSSLYSTQIILYGNQLQYL